MPENIAKTAADHYLAHLHQRFDNRYAKRDDNFTAIMSAIADRKKQVDRHLQAISALSERVAILESRHQ